MPSEIPPIVAHAIKPEWILYPADTIYDRPIRCRASLSYWAEATVDFFEYRCLKVPHSQVVDMVEDRLRRTVNAAIYPPALIRELYEIREQAFCNGTCQYRDPMAARELDQRIGKLITQLREPKK